MRSISLSLGTLDPNLKPGTVCVHTRLDKRHSHYLHPPSPASRAGTDLSTNVQAVSRAVSYGNTHRLRFQVRARPSYSHSHLSLHHCVTHGLLPSVVVLGCGFSLPVCARVWLCEDL